MKRKTILLILTLLLNMFSAKVMAYDALIDGIYYNLSGTSASVTYRNYGDSNEDAYKGHVIIPEFITYNGKQYTVASIGGSAFASCTGLASVTIPNSVVNIGWGLFKGCSNLAKIVVSSDNTVYDSRENCNAIIVTTTNELLFGCKATVIPNSVTSIGDHVFNGCTGLTSVAIPNSVTSIGNFAFSGCTGLTSITIPNSVTNIESSAFYGCSNLEKIVVSSDNIVYDSRGNCNAIIVTTTNDLILGCKATVIPNDVTSIEDYAFYDCTGLLSITIPISVTSIGGAAFCACTGLTSITIPNSVTTIGNDAFSGCTGLTSITIPNSITSIEHGVFRGCKNLASITIPNSVTSIGNYAFFDCSNLTAVQVENPNPINIFNETFTNCTNATLFVLVGCKAAYEAADVWNEFKEIVETNEVVYNTGTSLFAADAMGREDEQTELSIMLDKGELEKDIVGVSFTLKLPEGVSVAVDEDDEPLCALVNERANKTQFNVMPAQFDDGSWGFRVYTTSVDGIIEKSEGAFMNVTLQMASDMQDGDYTIEIKDCKLSVREANNSVHTVALEDAASTLTIENVILGDVNDDRIVDLSDAIMVIYYSLQKEPAGFIRKAADLNGDGEIDLSDAIIIIYKSLGVIDTRMVYGMLTIDSNQPKLNAEHDGSFLLSLDGKADYVGMQFDVELPEEAELSNVQLADEQDNGHSVTLSHLSDGRYRVMVFSPSGQPFADSANGLLKFTLVYAKTGNIHLSNMFLVGTDLQKHICDNQTTIVMGVSANVTREEVAYSLQGHRMMTPQKGICVKNSKKFVVK